MVQAPQRGLAVVAAVLVSGDCAGWHALALTAVKGKAGTVKTSGGSMCATLLAAIKSMGKRLTCGPTCAGTPASGPSFASGSFVASASRALMNCSDTSAPTQGKSASSVLSA